jgi:hypothetical protein
LAVGNSKIENEKRKVVVFGVFDHQIFRKREKKLPDLYIRFHLVASNIEACSRI